MDAMAHWWFKYWIMMKNMIYIDLPIPNDYFS